MVDITLGDVMSAVNTRATETKLTEVDTKIQTLLTNTDGLEGLLADIRDVAGIKKITDAVDIADRAARLLGKISADDGAIAALGALAATAVTDPTATASVIAVLKGLLKQLQGAGTGAAPVTLNGRNATSVNAFNALAITDTAIKLSGDLPIFRMYPHKAIIVLNSLDQSVTIQLYSNTVGGDYLTLTGITVIGGTPKVITARDSDFAMLDVLFSSGINIQIAAVCSTAPTSGALTVTVVGWF